MASSRALERFEHECAILDARTAWEEEASALDKSFENLRLQSKEDLQKAIQLAENMMRQRCMVEMRAILWRRRMRHLSCLLEVWRSNLRFSAMGTLMVELFAGMMSDTDTAIKSHKKELVEAMEATQSRLWPCCDYHGSPNPVSGPTAPSRAPLRGQRATGTR